VADRFYCPLPTIDGIWTLEGDEARHLTRVRRLGLGDRVELFDGRGFATSADVVAVGRERVDLRPVGPPLPDRLPACDLTLATAVPKRDRFDWLIEKATELGVAKVVPILTERSVVDPRDAKLDRLRRLIVEASKQCRRNRLMELDRPTNWAAIAADRPDAIRLVAHPTGVSAASWPSLRQSRSIVLAIGPEGGFTDAEVEAARERGWNVVSLGNTLLRIETAAIAGSAAILALCEGRN
jgi:16S rRNA (uracil1498-N3)-methyltransferase